jgi:negative regulator of replication initiation
MSKVLTIRVSDELYQRIISETESRGQKLSPYLEQVLSHSFSPTQATEASVATDITYAQAEEHAVKTLMEDLQKQWYYQRWGEFPEQRAKTSSAAADIFPRSINRGVETRAERRKRLNKLGSRD